MGSLCWREKFRWQERLRRRADGVVGPKTVVLALKEVMAQAASA